MTTTKVHEPFLLWFYKLRTEKTGLCVILDL